MPCRAFTQPGRWLLKLDIGADRSLRWNRASLDGDRGGLRQPPSHRTDRRPAIGLVLTAQHGDAARHADRPARQRPVRRGPHRQRTGGGRGTPARQGLRRADAQWGDGEQGGAVRARGTGPAHRRGRLSHINLFEDSLPQRLLLPVDDSDEERFAEHLWSARDQVVALALENTHLMREGHVMTPEAAVRFARIGVPVHLDGARLMNAAAALEVPPADLAACATTVTLTLSKGLGAPIGSVLAGPEEVMNRARQSRSPWAEALRRPESWRRRGWSRCAAPGGVPRRPSQGRAHPGRGRRALAG